MSELIDYDEQVYAGVLGKVIGVYMGRPFEGWTKERIQEKWGQIDRYVHEDVGASLVVSDDDITGTFTFIRALEDSGLYEQTPEEFFGKNWLNYLIEEKTILWWGGMGLSTEHTAYLRLKNGIPSPRSGSIELNGNTVAEQIGAQIFIDAFGMVCPGRPQLAAELGARSAKVSHDGEAVYAAQVVAAMVSAAFIEKEMDSLLDIGVSVVPADCLIAEVHRDIRKWAKIDKDWETTWIRISDKYGYDTYGGNCHVIPNHAIMVLAWVYAPDNFHQAQMIINTAGWDTDCNAANVGSVMGIKLGLDRINEDYDFQGPFADRLVIPTAEGSRGISDCLLESRYIAQLGRKIMGWQAQTGSTYWHDFKMPGACHGYMAETKEFNTKSASYVSHSALDGGALKIDYHVDISKVSRVSTPVSSDSTGWYGLYFTPRVYPGQIITVQYRCESIKGSANLRCFIRDFHEKENLHYNDPICLNKEGQVSILVPDLSRGIVGDFGFEISAHKKSSGTLYIQNVSIAGEPRLSFPHNINEDMSGWVFDYDASLGAFSDDSELLSHFGKNEGRGECTCGNDSWRDYTYGARLKIHLADKAGILGRYQGKEKYVALEKTRHTLRLVQRNYKETILDEIPCQWELDELHLLKLKFENDKVYGFCNGEKVLEGENKELKHGGAGFFYENGIIGIRDIKVNL
ncbi:MAG: ADP-ribosylglycohydrolase family protein [Lentisphaeria bacterium]|nr:ADP-ribosylglycohydrolase family protein [Lentisphaeria bacterium]